MSTPINDGGPAFPWREEDGAGGYCQHEGMSLRDWFAGQALSGLISNHIYEASPEEFAKSAYSFADAMLTERAKGGAK